MTDEAAGIPSVLMVESYLRNLNWSADDGHRYSRDEMITLVHGNIRGFAAKVREIYSHQHGWLIEKKVESGLPPIWWGKNGWTTNSADALRLARKEDAETMIKVFAEEDAIATEHHWG